MILPGVAETPVGFDLSVNTTNTLNNINQHNYLAFTIMSNLKTVILIGNSFPYTS